MNTEVLVTVLIMISSAGERGLEIVKTIFNIKERISNETVRIAVLLGINFLINLGITWGIWQQALTEFPTWLQNWVGVLIVSLIACGGSNVWHSALGFAQAITINKKDVTSTTQAPIGFLK